LWWDICATGAAPGDTLAAVKSERPIMHYDFVPMPERKPLKWPGGKRIAMNITFNMEFWDLTQDHDGPYQPGGPSQNERPMAARIPDYSNFSWREYGHRVGIWRLYDMC
jgi:hypothetical protein